MLSQGGIFVGNPCGHKLGGGDFWTRGYRELMTPIREEAVKRGGLRSAP